MTDDKLLSVEDLRAEYVTDEDVVTAVDEISFDINEGEIFGLVGESGSGKTTVAKSIIDLLPKNSRLQAEHIKYKGSDILRSTDENIRKLRREETGMVFQDAQHSLNPVISVGEQIAEVVRHSDSVHESKTLRSELKRKYLTGTSESSESWNRAVELLDMTGIPEPRKRAREYPHQLSGGMQQRVMIAQALAGSPSLLIADEPTTALDVIIESQILNKLLKLKEELGLSILLVTHDLGVVRQTCDRVAVMYAGELMEVGTVERIFDNPRHPYTRGLIDTIPQLDEERKYLSSIEGDIPDLARKPSGCPFRTRCPKAFEECTEPLQENVVAEDHSVHCHLYNQK